MQVMGMSVDFPTPMRPVLRVVLLDDGLAAVDPPNLLLVSVAEQFDTPSPERDWALLCRDFASEVTGRTSSLNPDVVVIRRADLSARPSNADGPRLKLILLGAVTAAAHQEVRRTRLRTGQACAQAYGKTKAITDSDASSLVTKTRVEAAAAALSGLWRDRT